MERLDLSDYDLVISSEAGPAKGVIVRPDALHLCYCHTPMRYLWDQFHQYYAQAGPASRLGMTLLSGGMRTWDVTSAARVDHFIANSTAVSARIKKYWRRDSDIVFPPVDTSRFKPRAKREDFYLYVGEFVPYKRADIAVEACNKLGKRLVVIGSGSGMKALKKRAGPTVEFLGRVPIEVLADYYSHCKALLFPPEEDFGITPVEAMASGAPVIAFNRGGARDYLRPGENGIFFEEQSADAMAAAIETFEKRQSDFNPLVVSRTARKFDRSLFLSRMQSAILTQMDQDKAFAANGAALRRKWKIGNGKGHFTGAEASGLVPA